MKKTFLAAALSVLLAPSLLSAGLLDAVSKDDVEEVKKSLARGDDINRADDGGFTPVMIAAERGNIAMLKILLAHRPKLEEKNAGGRMTALMLAVSKGRADIAELLLREGAYINARDAEEKTPLFFTGRKDVMTVLVKWKIDINAKDSFGRTALMHHYRYDGTEMKVTKDLLDTIAFLIRNGADVNAGDSMGMTPLMQAAACGYTEIMKLLLGKARINDVDGEMRTALIHAASNGRTAAVRLLVEKKAGLNMKDASGNTALSHAVRKKYKDIVKILKAAGAK